MRRSSTLAKELAEREGFEIGRVTLGISKLLNGKRTPVPFNPPRSPYLPPEQARENGLTIRPPQQAKTSS